MSLLRAFGKKHVELAKVWTPTVAIYGSAWTATWLYFLDWKAVMQYVPFYGSKFTHEPPR
jgi:ubiquinol-cytochrome c reductase subunit 10